MSLHTRRACLLLFRPFPLPCAEPAHCLPHVKLETPQPSVRSTYFFSLGSLVAICAYSVICDVNFSQMATEESASPRMSLVAILQTSFEKDAAPVLACCNENQK